MASPEIQNSERKNKRPKIKPKKGKCVIISGKRLEIFFSVPRYNVFNILLRRKLSVRRAVSCFSARGGTERLSAGGG